LQQFLLHDNELEGTISCGSSKICAVSFEHTVNSPYEKSAQCEAERNHAMTLDDWPNTHDEMIKIELRCLWGDGAEAIVAETTGANCVSTRGWAWASVWTRSRSLRVARWAELCIASLSHGKNHWVRAGTTELSLRLDGA